VMPSMSWSAKREENSRSTRLDQQKKIDGKRRHIDQINKVLQLLAKDEDLHDDLRMPSIVVAVDHWTGVRRLSIQEAEKLSENRRAMYVMQRMQMLQSVCRQAAIPVPLELMMDRTTTLSDEVITQLFGRMDIEEDIVPTSTNTGSILKKSDGGAIVDTKKASKVSKAEVAKIQSNLPSTSQPPAAPRTEEEAPLRTTSSKSTVASNDHQDRGQSDGSLNVWIAIEALVILLLSFTIAILLGYVTLPPILRSLWE
jgi:hypothetical protein